MTMLDDDRLASVLGAAGAAFEVPPSGAVDIVVRARAAGAPGRAGDEGGGGTEAGGDDGDGEGDGEDEVPAAVHPAGPTRRAHRVVVAASRHRVLSVAAGLVVVLVLVASVGALGRGSGHPSTTSALAQQHQRQPKGAPTHAPATTTTQPNHLPAAAGSTGGSQALRGQQFSASDGAAAEAPNSTPSTAPSLPTDAVGQSSKIEQTGTLGLSVGRNDLGRAMTALTGLATANGGFVADSQTQTGGSTGAASGSVTLQVPVDSFATVLKEAQKVGRTTSLTTKATDVTGQYVDLQSRIAALQASRQQYLTILTKATSVGDVLAVQAQLNTIETQIEQLQGQLQVLTSETAYSTLALNIAEGVPAPAPAPGPEPGVVRAWHDSVGGFVAGVDGIIRVAGPLLFALLCLAVVLLGGRALWRRVQRHRL